LLNKKHVPFASIATWSLFGSKSNCFASYGDVPWKHSEETERGTFNYLITQVNVSIDSSLSGVEFKNE
jgi:hypothetical protein